MIPDQHRKIGRTGGEVGGGRRLEAAGPCGAMASSSAACLLAWATLCPVICYTSQGATKGLWCVAASARCLAMTSAPPAGHRSPAAASRAARELPGANQRSSSALNRRRSVLQHISIRFQLQSKNSWSTPSSPPVSPQSPSRLSCTHGLRKARFGATVAATHGPHPPRPSRLLALLHMRGEEAWRS